MTRVPAEVEDLINDLKSSLPELLSSALVGLYLYGSLPQNAFNPKTSDVDCIAVTRRSLSDAQFKKLGKWLNARARVNPWFARLQMTILAKDTLLRENPGDSLYQFGVLTRSGSDGNPIIWINILKSGVVLYGPDPKSFVPPITKDILFKALEREVGYLREEIIDNPNSEWRDVPYYRVYAVLTLCRILYSFRKGSIVSKKRAATWAIRNLPEKWHKLVLQALAGDQQALSTNTSLSRIGKFIDFVDKQLHYSGD